MPCFVGLTLAEAAEVPEISEPTAKRHWAYARAWLPCELEHDLAP
ncbi:MAG TPA: ECF-type sigma factor [Verrucomicrobiota bacterium]|nr:ECF-type sigma factor [Verrucomicrobiota bacterium]HRZ38942.1 ECF-type sigma factor [Candidatus Paceibacterota bacterium]HRZ57173.1 ECF-type sigma factor [Candidatus Paceibacterota bacterium]